jgi:hypothetical protein
LPWRRRGQKVSSPLGKHRGREIESSQGMEL